MSKKKASTMTLKDFHGGSIPSDLPLPSAPGVPVVRPSDRDRPIPNAWGNPIGNRSDQYQRPRPGSSSAAYRNNNNNNNNSNYYDDKSSSFFSHPPHINIGIGRNFDEDERKPLDGVSLPRRTVSDNVLPTPTRFDPPKPQSPPTATATATARFSSASPVRYPAAAGSSSPPNAWGTRKDVVNVTDPSLHSSTWSAPNAVSKFAQATALEKVSSGRWQSKPHQQPEVQVITFAAHDHVPNNALQHDMALPTRNLSPKDTNLSFHRPPYSEAKLGGSLVEPVERPKIKLLPRSRPLENFEPPIVDYKQGYQLPSNSAHVEAVNESYVNEVSPKPGSAGSDGSRKAVERPRLNLKPRSQSLEQSHGIVEKERKSLFGGARPRELVLKERGVDEVVINNLDVIPPPNRLLKDDEHAKQDPGVCGDEKITERKDEGSWRRKQANPSDGGGVRYGKAASALELAQAFSGPRTGGERRNQVPFSRLTDTREFYSSSTTPRRQINGY